MNGTKLHICQSCRNLKGARQTQHGYGGFCQSKVVGIAFECKRQGIAQALHVRNRKSISRPLESALRALAEDGDTITSKGNPEAELQDKQAEAAQTDVVENEEFETDDDEELDLLLAQGEADEESTLYDKVVQKVVEPIRDRPAVRNLVALVSLYFVATFMYSAFKIIRKKLSPRAKKKRQVNKNLVVIDTLNQFLPAHREELTAQTLNQISNTTYFTKDLIFRKYLRYMLNERTFDGEAVSDLLKLKSLCALSDEQLKELFREIAQRTFKKYGILMTDTSGLTASSVMKKATERAIFSKLLYLAELPEMISQDAANLTENLAWQIQEIFGATSEDTASLRIQTLSELDAEGLENLMIDGEGIDEDEESMSEEEQV